MAISVRRAIEADLEKLRAQEARPDLGLVDRHFTGQNQGTLIFAVVLDGKQPIGSAVLDLEPQEYCPELRNMYIHPEARRKGGGRALSRFLEDEARAAGFTAVYLAVDPNNEKAVPLYVSLEYHPTGEHIFVEDPEIQQVEEGAEASKHYAVYKKSLTVR